MNQLSSVQLHNTKSLSILQRRKERASTTRQVKDLGKNEFLKLLITQLSHQDPLKPMEDKEFIAQMAQFSALEQMIAMNNTMNEMKAMYGMNKAFMFLGKSVKIFDDKTGKYIIGKVTEINITDSREPKVKVNNKFFNLKQIRGIVLDIEKLSNTDNSIKKIKKERSE